MRSPQQQEFVIALSRRVNPAAASRLPADVLLRHGTCVLPRVSHRSPSVPVAHLTHLKSSEVELRIALHAVNALTDRLRLKGEGATEEELTDLMRRIEAAAAHLRGMAASDPE